MQSGLLLATLVATTALAAVASFFLPDSRVFVTDERNSSQHVLNSRRPVSDSTFGAGYSLHFTYTPDKAAQGGQCLGFRSMGEYPVISFTWERAMLSSGETITCGALAL